MKKFFAILIVALLATSFAFSADGVGVVNVDVTHPAVTCETGDYSIDWDAVPNSTQAIDWTWTFKGACGVAFGTPTATWTGLGSWFTETGATVLPVGTEFDDVTGLADVQYLGTINCLPGTPNTTYTLTLIVSFDY